MNDRFVTVHVALECGEIIQIAPDDAQPAILFMMRIVPLAPTRKVVVESNRFDALVAQQPVREMASDESCATRDEESFTGHYLVLIGPTEINSNT